jgi:hypothetical protein
VRPSFLHLYHGLISPSFLPFLVQLRFSNVSSKLVFYLEGYDLVKPLGGVEQVQRSLEDVHAEVIRMLGEESARKKMQQLAEEEEGFQGPKPARSLTM